MNRSTVVMMMVMMMMMMMMMIMMMMMMMMMNVPVSGEHRHCLFRTATISSETVVSSQTVC